MQRTRGIAFAIAAMAMVGGAVTASAYLTDYPRYSAQAVRYFLAAVVLAVASGFRPQPRIVRPTGRQWWWLIAAATAGLSIYNLAVVHALDHAEPTVVATVVSGVPLVLAVGAPIVARRPVPGSLLAAAGAVVVGAALVQGGGRSDLAGVALSTLALAGEAGFTLLSLPVLARLGALSVATHTTWIAAVQLTVLALLTEGLDALPRPDGAVVAAVAYLIVASAAAFWLWFLAVADIGGELAGLAAGIIPAAAIATGLPLGVATIDARAIVGTALVTLGLVAGLRSTRSDANARPPSGAIGAC